MAKCWCCPHAGWDAEKDMHRHTEEYVAHTTAASEQKGTGQQALAWRADKAAADVSLRWQSCIPQTCQQQAPDMAAAALRLLGAHACVMFDAYRP